MARLTLLDAVLAAFCTALWGFNFVVIDWGLHYFPPLLFAALRFLFTAFPALLLVKPPHLPWQRVVTIGLLMGVFQFGSLFIAIHVGLSAGLASVVIQSQVIFTAAFGVVWLGERPSMRQGVGLVVALVGTVLIGLASGAGNSALGFALCLVAGASWGGANTLTRATKSTQPFALLVWSSAVAPLPLFLLSVIFEGTTRDVMAIKELNLAALATLAYVVIAATLFGFGVWYRLMSRYAAIRVAPFTVIVPVVGVLSALFLLGESEAPEAIAGAAVAVLGLVLAVTGSARAGEAGSHAEREGISGSANKQAP